MNPEIKLKFVEALRSGEYNQVRACLHDDAGYCCLGVLTEVVKGKDVGTKSVGRSHIFVDHNGNDAFLANDIRAEAQLSTSDCEGLMDMNDRGTHSFAMIADWIEENL